MGRKSTSMRGQLVTVIITTAFACSQGNESTSDSTSPRHPGDAGSSMGMNPGLKIGVLNGSDAGAQHECGGLECQQTTCSLGACKQKPCSAGEKTTVSGTVYDPAGKIPLYNVIVYIPNEPVPPIMPGASCDRCDASALNPLMATLTDTAGHFTLDDVPVGAEIPLVIQVGKWRRQVKLPKVAACTNTEINDKELTRLPRNQSEGDIPRIAITTGGADTMECLPLRMGVDQAEVTAPTDNGRIHLYTGYDPNGRVLNTLFDDAHGALKPPLADTLWGSLDELMKYDMVVLSCEGAPNRAQKPNAARQALYDYASAGGRVFASHFHYVWFSEGPDPVPSIATWNNIGAVPDPATGMIDTSFPKGKAMGDWLVNVQASTVPGQITIHEGRADVIAATPMLATPWITIHSTTTSPPDVVEYLSFTTPIGASDDKVCGRAVFNDLHVSASSMTTTGDGVGGTFPESCRKGDLSDQEKALEFMLFDLSSCVRKDDQAPEPPVIR